jgi:hypothetical protein
VRLFPTSRGVSQITGGVPEVRHISSGRWILHGCQVCVYDRVMSHSEEHESLMALSFR